MVWLSLHIFKTYWLPFYQWARQEIKRLWNKYLTARWWLECWRMAQEKNPEVFNSWWLKRFKIKNSIESPKAYERSQRIPWAD